MYKISKLKSFTENLMFQNVTEKWKFLSEHNTREKNLLHNILLMKKPTDLAEARIDDVVGDLAYVVGRLEAPADEVDELLI